MPRGLPRPPCSYLYRPHTCYRPKNIEPCLSKDICFSNFDFLWQNQGKMFVRFFGTICPYTKLWNGHLKKNSGMFSGWGWVPKPKQPWHPLLIFLPRGGGGRTMALGGRFVAEMNEEASDGRPCQPRTSAQEGEATLQNNCWKYARKLLFSSQDTSERVECSSNDTALVFPNIKYIFQTFQTSPKASGDTISLPKSRQNSQYE